MLYRLSWLVEADCEMFIICRDIDDAAHHMIANTNAGISTTCVTGDGHVLALDELVGLSAVNCPTSPAVQTPQKTYPAKPDA